MSNLYSLDYEKSLIAGLLAYPEVYADICQFVGASDFSKVNGAVYAALASHLTKNQTVSTVILAEYLKGMSVSFEDVEPYDYLRALELIPVKKEEVEALGKEVKKLSYMRDCQAQAKEILDGLPKMRDKTFEQIGAFMDQRLSSPSVYTGVNQTESMFEGMEEEFETRLVTPPDRSKIGFEGPYKSINDVIGPLTFEGAFCSIISRSGGGKSAWSWHYNTWMADKHSLPCLHLDCGEMTRNELRERAIASLSAGRVPYGDIVNGTWGNNKEHANIIRGEIWPKVRQLEKTGYWYHNVGDMSPDEIITFVRRFYFKHIPRGSMMLINLDYLKAFDLTNSHKNAAEHQVIGQFVKAFKTLITKEICASVTAGLQANRTGSYMNKQAGDINDSEETGALSDRIFQQSTHQFLMRHKVPEELAEENGLFGNVKLIPTKKRRLTGPRASELLRPILLQSGRYAANYFNLEVTGGFYYQDRGIQSDVMQQMGRSTLVTERTDRNDGAVI